MHVLVVAPHLPPTHVGGVEMYTQGLLSALAGRGARVEAVAVRDLASNGAARCRVEREEVDGYAVHRFTLGLPAGLPFPLLTDHVPAQQWFEARLRTDRPDVVHVQSGYLLGVPALAAAHGQGVPTVLTLHDYWFACPRVTLRQPGGAICTGAERATKCAWCLGADRRSHRILDRLTGGALTRGQDRSMWWRTLMGGPAGTIEARRRRLVELLQRVDVVLAPTHFVADQVSVIGVPRARITISRCGIPPFPRRQARRTDRLRLAFIGQIAPHKGIHLAVDAVQALKDRPVLLDIHGPLTPYPEYVAELRRLAGDDPRIRLRGPYRREALPELFAEADAVVVPSVWHEVGALVIQEAQMAGVPVLVSSLGGSPELVRHDVDGLIFDPDHAGDLQRQIARLLDEPGLLERLAAAVRPPRTVDDEIDGLLHLYRGLRRAA